MDHFEIDEIQAGEARIFVRWSGSGPPLLLLHGFPQTHLIVARCRAPACPVLALWSARGALDTWYAKAGGPIALWREWGDDVRGHSLNAGHFFPKEAHEQTAEMLDRFFAVHTPKAALG